MDEMKFTPREWDIIKLILQGKTNPEIGDLLFISTKTVKNNLTEIYKKLNVRNRVQMVRKISRQVDTKD
jgi:DNA-binding NarL/FixJ family response regulator